MMDDQSLLNAVKALERQLTYQTQIGGTPLAREPGRFLLDVIPYMNRRSERIGVAERHYTANLRQEGQFVERTATLDPGPQRSHCYSHKRSD